MNDQREAELSIILRRNRSWLISMAGLDAGITDYSLRNDLLRLVELAELAGPPGHKSEGDAPASTVMPTLTHALPASTPTNPAAPPSMYKGWVNFSKLKPDEARAKLVAIGVKVGVKVDSDTFTDCEVSAEAMAKLDTLWGEFLWHLEPVQAPAPEPIVYRGEITCRDITAGMGEARRQLERAGVIIGVAAGNPRTRTFHDCEIPAAALAKLRELEWMFVFFLAPTPPPPHAPAPASVYRGWIICRKLSYSLDQAVKQLSEIGVTVKEVSGSGAFKDCLVPALALPKLEALSEIFVWFLAPTTPARKDSFLKFLEGQCPGDDAHDGLGDPRPLLERCGMCRGLYEAHLNAMKEAGK